MEGFEVFLVVLAVLVVLAGVAFYVATRYDDPPLWWPNFMRPGWAKVRERGRRSARGNGKGVGKVGRWGMEVGYVRS